MTSQSTNTPSNFRIQSQTPLTGPELLRYPQTPTGDNQQRPFTPAMGNESDTYLRFTQRPFFKAKKAGRDTSQYEREASYLQDHLRFDYLKEDYSTEPKPVRGSADDELIENGEYRKFIQAEMRSKKLSPYEGIDLELSLIRAENNLKPAKTRAEDEDTNNISTSDVEDNTNSYGSTEITVHEPKPTYRTPSQNDINRAAGRSYVYTFDENEDSDEDNEDDDDYHLYSQAERLTAKEPSQNDINRASGRSYMYTIDDSEDPEEEEDNDDYHLHSQAEPSKAKESSSPGFGDGDSNINFSDPDPDSSDDDDGYPQVAKAQFSSPVENITQEVETTDSKDNESAVEVYYHAPIPTVMGGFDMACETYAVQQLTQALVVDLKKRNDDYKLYTNNYLSSLSYQRLNGKLNQANNRCAWGLIPLDPSVNKLYPPWTEAPGIILTNPEGERFELEENEFDFSDPSYDEFYKWQEEYHRKARIIELQRRKEEEAPEDTVRAEPARRYWTQAQERRDENIWWESVNERARLIEQREKAAAAAVTHQEMENKDVQDEESCENADDDEENRHTASESDTSSEHCELVERILSDPEEYCQTNGSTSDERTTSQDGTQEYHDASSHIGDGEAVEQVGQGQEVCSFDSQFDDVSLDCMNTDSMARSIFVSTPFGEESSVASSMETDSNESGFDDVSLFNDIDQDTTNNFGTGSRTTTPGECNNRGAFSPSPTTQNLDLAIFEVEEAHEELEEFQAKVTVAIKSAKKKYQQAKSFQGWDSKEKKLYGSKFHYIWSVRHFAARLSRMAEDGLKLDEDYQGPGVRFISENTVGANEVFITGALAEFVPDLIGGAFINLRLLTAWLGNDDIGVRGRSNTELFSELKEMLTLKRTVSRKAVDTYQALMEGASMKWRNVELKPDDRPTMREDRERADLVKHMEKVKASELGDEGKLVVWEMGQECFTLIVRDRNGGPVAV